MKPEFGVLIRGLDSPAGVVALVASLGLDAADVVLAPDEARGCGIDSAVVRRVHRLVDRGAMRVLLIELEGRPQPRVVAGVAVRIARAGGARQALTLFAGPDWSQVVIVGPATDGTARHLTLERASVRASDIDTLREMVACPGEGAASLAMRWSRALDRSRVSARFFMDFGAQRSRVSAGWLRVPVSARADRDQLALLFLSRMMFLYFLQRSGHLAGDDSFLVNLFRARNRRSRRTFFRGALDALFFGVLNARPESRSASARRLGPLPYLNGGLFERTALERTHSAHDLPDAVVAGVFDNLLEKYRFTSADRADDTAGGGMATAIDPGMLGRVFEGMMSSDRRGDTGTFYTPAGAVDGLVRETLAAHLAARLEMPHWLAADLVVAGNASMLDDEQRLRVGRALGNLRVLDPACGSGAFLLGALSRLAPLRSACEGRGLTNVKRDIVASGLHGVDVQSDAALLCALRLWLALTLPAVPGETLAPLPNLDRRVRQGDALVDPLDLARGAGAGSVEAAVAADATVRRHAAALAPLGLAYVHTEPGEREAVARRLRDLELGLAAAWLDAIDRRLQRQLSDLRARASQRDLWGERTTDAIAASAAVPRLEADRRALDSVATRVAESGSLPFFSFAVHFADAALDGFDVVLANPPWVRAHRWPATLRRMVRDRYRVCRDRGWTAGTELAHAPAAGAQIDLSLLFLEKSIRLLADRGALGMLLPARLIRSMYGAAARRMLLADTRLVAIDDHSLDQHSIFAADAFAVSVVAVRTAQPAPQPTATDSGPSAVRVTLHRRKASPLSFTVPHDELPLCPGDHAAPWLLAPPPVRKALRRMQRSGQPLGRILRVRRGVFTGANDVMIVRDAAPRIGGLVSIRAGGWSPAGSAATVERRGRSHAHRLVRSAAVAEAAPDPTAASPADYEALIEASCLRPVVRGTDVSAWRCELARWIVWLHGEDGRQQPPPPRTAAYLARHAVRLAARTGLRRGAGAGGLFRVSREALGHKVLWHDLALTLEAVAVPAVRRNPLGLVQPIIPLNTTYFIAAASESDAFLLAAILNSLPMRVFARTIAERAKDARFRFFAWTVGVLPLPDSWRDPARVRALTEIARRGHADAGLDDTSRDELDTIVARMCGLDIAALDALREFDAWLSGAP